MSHLRKLEPVATTWLLPGMPQVDVNVSLKGKLAHITLSTCTDGTHAYIYVESQWSKLGAVTLILLNKLQETTLF